MTTIHIENTVGDFDTWKANFDKYERFRAEQGVRSYRVSRSVTEPNEVLIDLEFGDETAAQAFLPKLEQIMNSPQARTQLVRHSVPPAWRMRAAIGSLGAARAAGRRLGCWPDQLVQCSLPHGEREAYGV